MRCASIAPWPVAVALAAAVVAASVLPPFPATANTPSLLQRRQGDLASVWLQAQADSELYVDDDLDREGLIPPKWDEWSYQEIPGAVCADGSQAGIGYSWHRDATELVIYLSAGGGCWNTENCFKKPQSVYLTGFNETTFMKEKRGSLSDHILIVSRLPKWDNPWKRANYLFVPYCSGDFHAGNNTVTYEGAPAPIHHRGANNFKKILDWAARSAPNMEEVWISGTSAGCYGAVLNYVPTQKAFPRARVHMMADSCVGSPGLFDRRPTWKAIQPGGVDCPECKKGDFNSFIPALSKANPKSRFALFTFEVDGVLPYYVDVTRDVLTNILNKFRSSVNQVKTGVAKTFTVPGTGHCVFYTRNPKTKGEVPLQGWLNMLHDLSNGNTFTSAS